MEAKKEAKLNMYNTVIALCEGNLAIIALVVAFQTTYNAFKTTVAAIAAAAVKLEEQTGGLATSKRSAKKELATLGSGIAGLVFAYASVINDEDLKGQMKITFTDVNDAKDDEVVPICQHVFDVASANLGVLGDYGVTAALLGTFQTAITDYSNKAPKPRLSRSERKAIRAQMNTMFKDADKLLKEQMDKTALVFMHNGNAEFYGAYAATRVIVDPGSFGTVLKLLVLNGVTNQPIRGAKSYRDESAVAKVSTDKGFVTYKNIEEGNHSFVVKHKLFLDKEATVMMSHNEKKTVVVLMEPKP